MAQLIIKDYGHQTIKESTEELFGLIEDDKQFIFVEIKHTIDIGKNEFEYKTRVDWVKTAINKAHIIQAF